LSTPPQAKDIHMKFINSFTGFRSPSGVIDELNSSEEKA
jgi:hypothetical protein